MGFVLPSLRGPLTGPALRAVPALGPGPYLPATNLLAARGTRRLVEGYAGPLVRVVRASDSAVLDVGCASGSDNIDVAALATFRAASSLAVDVIYDQSGNANHLTQTVSGSRGFVYETNLIDGNQPVTMVQKFYNEPAEMTGLPRQVATYDVAFCQSGGMAGPTTIGALNSVYNANGAISVCGGRPLQIYSTTNSLMNVTGVQNRTQPCVIAVSGSASNIRVYRDKKTGTVTAPIANAWTGGFVGKNSNAGITPSHMEWFGRVIYAATHDAATMQANRDILAAQFSVNMDLDTQIVLPGNSIVVGFSFLLVGVTRLLSYVRQAQTMFSRPIQVFNQAQTGQTFATQYAARTTYSGMFDATLVKNIMQVPEPTNDIEARASGTIVGHGAALWAAYGLPFIDAMQAAGFSCIVPTIIDRAWTGSGTDISQKETERLAYNALVRANAVAEGYIVADYAALTVSKADGIHPDNAGALVMAPVFADAVDSWL